jgi:enoyl-CoA hydratase/carnithine racemase
MTHAGPFSKPLIAAVNGACVGFGLVQALHCDVRLAGRSASFATAFTRRGLNAEYGSSWLLPRIIGQTRAADLLLSGRRIDAEEAERIGLVNRVVADDELLPRALDYARDLADNCSPVAMADTKQQLQADWDGDRIASEDRAKQLGLLPGHRVDFEEGEELRRAPPAPLCTLDPRAGRWKEYSRNRLFIDNLDGGEPCNRPRPRHSATPISIGVASWGRSR